jgi:hypothetical protein
MGFRPGGGGAREKATYASGGNNLIAESRGFTEREGHQSYEWRLTLKQTRRWEGTVKFYAVLLAAFALPQTVKVTLEGRTLVAPERLKAHAEAAIVRDFGLDDLLNEGVYRPGDGIQFT